MFIVIFTVIIIVIFMPVKLIIKKFIIFISSI